jgi:hypothetical protein
MLKYSLSFFLLLSALFLFAYRFHTQVTPGDQEEYQQLLRESAELHSKNALERQPAHQTRHRVQKDIWAFKNGKRVHFRVQSDLSELEISQKKGKFEAVEHLEDVSCFVQENLSENEQQIRTLKAERAVSYFPSHRFGAENIDVAFFKVPGTEMPNSMNGMTPFLTGTADVAKLLDELSLEGNVRIASHLNQEKKSFAVSDRLIYHPQTQMMALSSDSPNRVLFWQDGLSLSASAIEVRRDPHTGIDRVQGVGDVRCCFSAEEKNFIEQLFSKYF